MSARATDLPQPGAGAKMLFLIRRRPTASREELLMHWFANHMPGVIHSQQEAAAAGRPHAWRYIATAFADGDPRLPDAWDGVAALWWDQPLPKPREPFGVTPRDSFQQKAEPYVPWATVEYVIVDGAERLAVEPLTLNAPFPTTRSGFHKVTILVTARADTDYQALYRHWLTVHAPNVASALEAAGGFRYVLSLSLDPAHEPYAGMVEFYFSEPGGWQRLRAALQPDGMERWVDAAGVRVLTATTEMIGIP